MFNKKETILKEQQESKKSKQKSNITKSILKK